MIKMILNGRSPTMRHVSRTHRVALDWLFDRINLDHKIQIKYIDTKNQLADMLTKGNFTRDEWNHLLCLFNVSHSSSAECSEGMSRRTQKESGEERVTAKSRPMMNLIARSSERAPSTLSSAASESPVKTRHESQNPLSPQAEKYDRTERPVVCSEGAHRPVVCARSPSYSEWNVDKTWSSQEWKSDELMEDRTGRPAVCSQRASQTRFSRDCENVILEEEANHDRTGRPAVCSQRASQTRFSRDCENVILEEEANHDRTGRPVVCSQRAHQFVVEDNETESELSLGSRSFLHRVNDQVRKRQKQFSMDATKDGDKHSVIWGMFISSTSQTSVFMGNNYSDNWHSIKNTEDLTMKQMLDISEKLVSEQSDEIFGVETINWEDSSWKYLSLIGDEEVISLRRTKVYVFSDSVLCLRKMNENPQSNMAWEDRLTWFKSLPEDRALDRIDGEPMQFEWNIFTGFTTLQLSHKVQELLLRLSVTPEKFTGRIIFMSMFNDI